MSKRILIPYDFNKNEIQNVLFQNLGSAPGSPSAGQFYYNTGTNRFFYYNGTAFVNLATDSDLLNAQAGTYYLARANHTGTQLAATISDFTTAVNALQWRSMTAPTGAVNMNSQNFSSLAAASGAGQAVEYSQWQTAIGAAIAGLSFKTPPATVVMTTNVTLTAPGATMNGHTMVSGDSFLASGQTTTTQNGLYTWNGSAVTATRRSDANSAGSVYSGTLVSIENADSTNPDTVWMQTATGSGTNGAIVLGTDVQTWIKPFSASAYTFSNGLLNSSGTITVLPDPVTGGGIVVTSAGVKIDTAVVVRKFAVDVGDGSSTAITVTHNLGTLDVTAAIYNKSTGAEVECDVVHATTNTLTLNFSVAPTSAQYRAVVHG